mgnify:CR=1 FL=1
MPRELRLATSRAEIRHTGPGPGSEAGESREYRPGDDVRRMDWPVTARTTVPHVRRTVADRELARLKAQSERYVADRQARLDSAMARLNAASDA